MKSRKITLEEVQERKLKVCADIQAQQKLMLEMSQEIFSPLSTQFSKSMSLYGAFKKGFNLFNGAMMGIRFLQKIKGLFK